LGEVDIEHRTERTVIDAAMHFQAMLRSKSSHRR
jgi:hypothetical protein